MLNPDVVLNSVLASLRSIPQLATELGAPEIPATDSITAHYSYSGEENAYIRVLAQMRSPSILVAYLDYTMGNYDGQTVWKHRLNLCCRSRNKAANGSAVTAQSLWWMAMNLPVSVPEIAPNIRYIDLANGMIWLAETNLKSQTDELGQDFYVSTLVFNEYGDAGPDGLEFLCVGPAKALVEQTRTAAEASQSVADFAQAIMRNLSAEQRRQLIEEVREGAHGVTHTK